jgi:hypothetical protein
MQQKIIIVPKDKTALKELDFDEAKPDQLIEYILTEKEFSTLYNTGVIDSINEIGNSNIEEFEDDVINDEKRLSDVLDFLMKSNESSEILNPIIHIFQEAIKRKTAVFFYF